MGLTADDLLVVEELLGADGAGSAAVTELRRRFPRLSVTFCDASDLDSEAPFRACRAFTLYLVDGTSHCWKLTNDPAGATGLVVARHRASA